MVVSKNISTDAVLKATGVNVFYGSHLAVKDCNIDIPLMGGRRFARLMDLQ